MTESLRVDKVRERILVVDDEESTRVLLTRILREAGYETRSASGGEEAMEILASGEFDLVLSDIEMPGVNGVELLKKVRGMNRDVQVVMATGILDTDVALDTIRQGATDYITKPFNLEQVRVIVRRALERRSLILENRAFQCHLEERVAEQTRELRRRQAEVEDLYRNLENTYETTLHALMTALDYRDHETQGHSWRVVQYCILIAKKLQVQEPELTWIRWGSILHDVGKIGLPDSILKKPGKLDEAEWAEMTKHPGIGYKMLQHIEFLEPALEIVLCHHERWDGAGYPRQLKGDEIPLGARIFAVVDTFDAMTSDRPYRSALSIQTARQEILDCSGSQFDPEVVKAFSSFPDRLWNGVRARVHDEALGIDEQVRQMVKGSGPAPAPRPSATGSAVQVPRAVNFFWGDVDRAGESSSGAAHPSPKRVRSRTGTKREAEP